VIRAFNPLAVRLPVRNRTLKPFVQQPKLLNLTEHWELFKKIKRPYFLPDRAEKGKGGVSLPRANQKKGLIDPGFLGRIKSKNDPCNNESYG
jgi:hypothetical protein